MLLPLLTLLATASVLADDTNRKSPVEIYFGLIDSNYDRLLTEDEYLSFITKIVGRTPTESERKAFVSI